MATCGGWLNLYEDHALPLVSSMSIMRALLDLQIVGDRLHQAIWNPFGGIFAPSPAAQSHGSNPALRQACARLIEGSVEM